MRGSVHVTAVLLLMLVAVAAVVAIALILYPRASRPASKPLLPRVEIEEVKAYVVKGDGTYILLYDRNVGDTSINIKRLEELGISVYVYDWRGDLIAANTSARVVKEGVPDGVWEPGELVVVEAHVPVPLLYASLEVASPTGGYVIVETLGHGAVRLEARLTPSNIRLVEAAQPVCYLALPPGSTLVVLLQAAGASYPKTATTLFEADIVFKPLNSTWAASLYAYVQSGFYVLNLGLFTIRIPFFMLALLSAGVTGGSGAAQLSVSAIGSATGARATASIDASRWHTLRVYLRVPQPTTGTVPGLVEYNGTVAGAALDSTAAEVTGLDYYLTTSINNIYAQIGLTTSTNYTAVRGITVTYFDYASGTLKTLSWAPTSVNATLPPWLVVYGSYTIVCGSGGWQPPT